MKKALNPSPSPKFFFFLSGEKYLRSEGNVLEK